MQGTVVVGDAAEIEAFVVAQEAAIAAEEAAAAAADAAWAEANPGVVKNAPGSATPGCEATNSCFIPSTITVSAGQGITWYNDDNAAHTATGGTPTDGPSGAFDSSLMMAGGSYNHRIDEPGTYPYFCMVHPWMTGTVIVEATEQTEEESEQIEFEPTPEVVETEAEVVSESDEITTGSEIQIETDIVNQKDDSQIFAYIVQIKYEDGTPVSISTVTGSLAQGQTLTQTISWTPDEPGTYVAEIFIWDDLDSANPLSNVEIQYFTVT
jgi:plastocyanin